VTIHEGESVTTLVDDNRSSLGPVFAFAQQRDRIWIGSERGLWQTDGKQVRPVMGSNGPFSGVAGIVSSATGELWLNTADGVVRIAAAEVSEALNAPEHRVRYQLLDRLDGSPLNAAFAAPYPKAAMDGDGRIWFAGADAVAWFDPSRAPIRSIPMGDRSCLRVSAICRSPTPRPASQCPSA
jgi:ligand-binding sensor domain-containing protein